jgi:hypothetical protein
MASFKEYRRRILLPLIGAGLAAYYVLVFIPLSRRAEALDVPMQAAWRKLASSLEQTNAATIDFLRITNQLSETRQAIGLLEEAKKRAFGRLELSPTVKAHLAAPFQLVEFENERGKQRDELEKSAKAQQTRLDPAVLAGFPTHTADLNQPELLWAALAFADDLLDTAVRCKVASIESLEVPLAVSNSVATDGPHWLSIPLQLEFTANADNALKMIQSLPLRGDEARAAGLPEANQEKLPLLLERVVIKKQNPARLDEVHVWLRALGFVLRD